MNFLFFISKAVATILFAFFPVGVAFAKVSNFKDLAYKTVDFLNLATATLLALAVAFFFFSIVRNLFSYSEGDANTKKELHLTLTWGILIIFVMVSIWGIIAILQTTLINGL